VQSLRQGFQPEFKPEETRASAQESKATAPVAQGEQLGIKRRRHNNDNGNDSFRANP
jgi:hypothetical protein